MYIVHKPLVSVPELSSMCPPMFPFSRNFCPGQQRRPDEMRGHKLYRYSTPFINVQTLKVTIRPGSRLFQALVIETTEMLISQQGDVLGQSSVQRLQRSEAKGWRAINQYCSTLSICEKKKICAWILLLLMICDKRAIFAGWEMGIP